MDMKHKILALLQILVIFGNCNGLLFKFKPIKKEDGYIRSFKTMIDAVTLNCDVTKPITNRDVSPDKLFLMFYTNGTLVPFPVPTAVDSITQHPDFKINQMTMVYSHGFNGDPDSPEILRLGAALLNKGYNLITFDTRAYLAQVNYLYVANILDVIAGKLFDFLYQMYQKGLPIPNLYMLGHSLGAQISGMVARKFRKDHNITLPRITGLDPASPCFPNPGVNALGPNDAMYVDVIFTSALSYNPAMVGRTQFYVNGRHQIQPGCLFPGLDLLCSHSRSRHLFVESVENTNAFLAKRCKDINHYDCQLFDIAHMGFVSNINDVGNYQLDTNFLSPFDKGIFGLL